MFASPNAQAIAALIDAHAASLGLKPSTVSLRIAGQGQLWARLRKGAEITHDRATRIAQQLSDHWPLDAEWPHHLTPRPTPAPPPGDPLAVIRELRERRMALTDPDREGGPVPFHVASANCAALIVAAGSQINENGRLASRDALALALQVSRKTVDNVISRPGKRPTRGDAQLVYDTLVEAGDARFARRLGAPLALRTQPHPARARSEAPS